MSSQTQQISVIHNTAQQRFEARMEHDVAFLSYSFEGERVIFEHTYVPPQFRGKGVAATLARAALNEARQQGWRIVPQCSYVAAFIERNPEFAGLEAGRG